MSTSVIQGRESVAGDFLSQCNPLQKSICAVKIIIDDDHIVDVGFLGKRYFLEGCG